MSSKDDEGIVQYQLGAQIFVTPSVTMAREDVSKLASVTMAREDVSNLASVTMAREDVSKLASVIHLSLSIINLCDL